MQKNAKGVRGQKKTNAIIFDVLNIDNNAIHLIIDQLWPFLRYDPDSEFRVLDLDHENVSEKQLLLYEEIFIPYCTECSKHHSLHHNCSYPDSWLGEQTCLSMIHYLNQKAWWLLHYYAIEEAIRRYCSLSDEMLDRITSTITYCILDRDASIADAVNNAISGELNMEKDIESLISNDIAHTIEKYKEEPSTSMVYR
ncbi:MAG: hypothetical protein IJ083_14355 [Clostridia bacterium]|nr:hypothetical protein [Clostridia bacterium]